MATSKGEIALLKAAIYFGSEVSAFDGAVSSGVLPVQEHGQLIEHTDQVLRLAKRAIKELHSPKGGGNVSSGNAYAALRKLVAAVTELCEETHIVPTPLPGKPRRM